MHVRVYVALVLLSLLALVPMVMFHIFGPLHLRRIQRTGHPVRQGEETRGIGLESVEGLRRGGPLLLRAGGVLEAEHGFRGELQVDGENGAVHGQAQAGDTVLVGPGRPQRFALDQGRIGTWRGWIAAGDEQQETRDCPPDEKRADPGAIERGEGHHDGTVGGCARTA